MREREAIRWLQLTYKVPSEPSQKRVWVWRRLQNLGVFALQNSVYLLPYSEEVEKQFRQLIHDIHEMGGEGCLFSVFALDSADEQRILQTLVEARHGEYQEVIALCVRFLVRVRGLLEGQEWNEQVHAECAECLEKVHIVFRSAKRHDLLGSLTATRRALAAENLVLCEQLFRLLLDHDYARARRVLELHSELVPLVSPEEAPLLVTSLVLPTEQERVSQNDSYSG